jgi:PAS domain S-box-containing protein
MARILIYVEQAENRRLLAEWLANKHDIIEGRSATDLRQSFDLCIIDSAALKQYDDELVRRKEREHPVLLPYLQIVPERQFKQFTTGVWKHLDAIVKERIDEVITTPIKKAELDGRLQNLLNSRQLSLQLREQREQYRRLLQVAPETIATVDTDGAITYINSQGTELFGIDDATVLSDVCVFDFFHEDDRGALRSLVEGVANRREQSGFVEGCIGGDDDRRYVEVAGGPITYNQEPAVQLVIHDITERREREREVEQQRDALRKLDRLNAVIRNIDQALVKASSRKEIEQAVADRLAAIDTYAAAWIGTDRASSHVVEPRAIAGDLDGYFDEVTITVSGSGSEGPTGNVFETQDVHVVQDTETDPSFERWRDASLKRGYRSSIAVPILYNETLYGVLNIYASKPNAFDPDEQAVLKELGETIGHAINAAESRRALVTDRVVELDLKIADTDQFLAFASEAFDCAFTFEGLVIDSSERYIEYFASDCDDPRAVLERADESSVVEHARIVGDIGEANFDEVMFEFSFSNDLLVRTLGDLGGRIKNLRVEDGVHCVTAEFPVEVQIHAVVKTLESSYDTVSLAAQRETQRPLQTRQGLRASFQESLTERQWSAIQTAFFAGYFEWPRESTGEEVAESLGISPSTLHQHLRAAERKLLEAILRS